MKATIRSLSTPGHRRPPADERHLSPLPRVHARRLRSFATCAPGPEAVSRGNHGARRAYRAYETQRQAAADGIGCYASAHAVKVSSVQPQHKEH